MASCTDLNMRKPEEACRNPRQSSGLRVLCGKHDLPPAVVGWVADSPIPGPRARATCDGSRGLAGSATSLARVSVAPWGWGHSPAQSFLGTRLPPRIAPRAAEARQTEGTCTCRTPHGILCPADSQLSLTEGKF